MLSAYKYSCKKRGNVIGKKTNKQKTSEQNITSGQLMTSVSKSSTSVSGANWKGKPDSPLFDLC